VRRLRAERDKRLPDRCTITNVPGDTAVNLPDVPCAVIARQPQTAVTDDGAGGTITTTLQRWEVTIVARQDLPTGKARISATVEGVAHTFETTTRVPQGQSNQITITLECEEVFGA
jgi:hypothetical protein